MEMFEIPTSFKLHIVSSKCAPPNAAMIDLLKRLINNKCTPGRERLVADLAALHDSS